MRHVAYYNTVILLSLTIFHFNLSELHHVLPTKKIIQKYTTVLVVVHIHAI